MITNSKLQRMWLEPVAGLYKALFQNLHGRAGENDKKPQSDSLYPDRDSNWHHQITCQKHYHLSQLALFRI
jgi:hypothetical protein